MNRRGFLAGLAAALAAPAIIRTPGLLMPIIQPLQLQRFAFSATASHEAQYPNFIAAQIANLESQGWQHMVTNYNDYNFMTGYGFQRMSRQPPRPYLIPYEMPAA